jgi:hypothetical protein
MVCIVVAKYGIVFESKESLCGFFRRSRDWIEYSGVLMVKDGGRKPVSLEMKFVPPHPFPLNLPEEHIIKAESITEAYVKLVKFFNKYGIEFRS